MTIGKPLTEQLRILAAIELPCLTRNAHIERKQDERKAVADIEQAVDQVLLYLCNGKQVLGGLQADDDVQWVYEGRQMIEEIRMTILKAGDIMTQLMTILEGVRGSQELHKLERVDEEEEETKQQEDNVSLESNLDCPEDINRDTNLSDKCITENGTRNEASRAAPRSLHQMYLDTAEKIEQTIKVWREILELVDRLRGQINISHEWKDLYEEILTELANEVEQCRVLVFEIGEKIAEAEKKPISELDIDRVGSVMSESPFPGSSTRLPSLNEFERDMNTDYIELTRRLGPLTASLKFLPTRIEQYGLKAKKEFPSSIQILEQKYAELRSKCNSVEQDCDRLGKQLGQDRWERIFHDIGRRGQDMLVQFKTNLGIINQEQERSRKGLKVDRIKMDRCATKNGYLMPTISRYISILDRAIRDNLATDPGIVDVHKSLHDQWVQLLCLAETKQALDELDVTNSPCPKKPGTSMGMWSRPSLEAPNLNLSSCLSLTHQHQALLEPSSPEIVPLRGLAIKYPKTRHNKASLSGSSTSSVGSVSTPSRLFSPSLSSSTYSNPSSPEISSTLMGSTVSSTIVSAAATNSGYQNKLATTTPSKKHRHSHIPVLSPELTRSIKTMTKSSTRAEPRLELDTPFSVLTISDTPSKIPRANSRSSSRLSDIGELVVRSGSRLDSPSSAFSGRLPLRASSSLGHGPTRKISIPNLRRNPRREASEKIDTRPPWR